MRTIKLVCSLRNQKYIYLIIIIFVYLSQNNTKKVSVHKKRIGVINLPNGQNVGNILVKFAMFNILKHFGLNATIITPKLYPIMKVDLSFIHRTINSNLLELKEEFSELHESDYDYLIVNSDQTWALYGKYFFDVGFLQFAENWKIPKLIYATSIGSDFWPHNNVKVKEKIKKLLKSFSGISFREKGLIKLAEENLGIKGVFVLDPTLLLEQDIYLKEIKDYNNTFYNNDKYIFVYNLHPNKILERIAKESSEKFNYKIKKLQINKNDYIENFIYGLNNSQAVLTDSFHGTIFSLMFNKPFISFIDTNTWRLGKGRFDSLKEVFKLENRIVDPLDNINISLNLLLETPNINKTLFNELKRFSINYLKKNLDILWYKV